MVSRWAFDHLVVAARTLAEGVAWCEAVLGVTPGPGGRHALMGTHNRLLSVASPAFPRAYLEIIAIDPDASPPGRARWFDLDDAALQAQLAAGPRLVHWVAHSSAIETDRGALRDAGCDPGEIATAERQTPQGLLQWRITLRADGRRQWGGALPALIAWGERHPADTLPASGVALQAVQLGPVPADAAARLPAAVAAKEPAMGGAALAARLRTPRGDLDLVSAP